MREERDGNVKEKEEGKVEDERREAVLASKPSLQPNFKRTGVTQEQLLKLQELHKRRLQIKSKSRIHKKEKGEIGKSQDKNLVARTSEDRDSSMKTEELTAFNSNHNSNSDGSSTELDNKMVDQAPKKRQKLYWGLDTKERWERKANM